MSKDLERIWTDQGGSTDANNPKAILYSLQYHSNVIE